MTKNLSDLRKELDKEFKAGKCSRQEYEIAKNSIKFLKRIKKATK